MNLETILTGGRSGLPLGPFLSGTLANAFPALLIGVFLCMFSWIAAASVDYFWDAIHQRATTPWLGLRQSTEYFALIVLISVIPMCVYAVPAYALIAWRYGPSLIGALLVAWVGPLVLFSLHIMFEPQVDWRGLRELIPHYLLLGLTYSVPVMLSLHFLVRQAFADIHALPDARQIQRDGVAPGPIGSGQQPWHQPAALVSTAEFWRRYQRIARSLLWALPMGCLCSVILQIVLSELLGVVLYFGDSPFSFPYDALVATGIGFLPAFLWLAPTYAVWVTWRGTSLPALLLLAILPGLLLWLIKAQHLGLEKPRNIDSFLHLRLGFSLFSVPVAGYLYWLLNLDETISVRPKLEP